MCQCYCTRAILCSYHVRRYHGIPGTWYACGTWHVHCCCTGTYGNVRIILIYKFKHNDLYIFGQSGTSNAIFTFLRRCLLQHRTGIALSRSRPNVQTSAVDTPQRHVYGLPSCGNGGEVWMAVPQASRPSLASATDSREADTWYVCNNRCERKKYKKKSPENDRVQMPKTKRRKGSGRFCKRLSPAQS